MRPLAQRSLLGRGWRLGFACCALSLGAACMDGYPTEDALILSPFNMTQKQRLVAMNTIGDDAHSERSWSYDLLPGCVLRIDFDGEQGLRPAFQVALLGSAIEIARDRVDNTFNVAVAEPGDHSHAAASVLESQDWALASRTQLLLRVLQRGCSDASGTTISKIANVPGQHVP
jgi:hypothetical protein